MPSYIVECLSCQQPWEVPTHLLTTPDARIMVPAHMMLSQETSEPLERACAGAVFSGIGMGERDQWERVWPVSHPGRPLPAVLDGSNSIKVDISN